MKRMFLMMMGLVYLLNGMAANKPRHTWPDGTPMDRWFCDTTRIDVNSLGRKFIVTDYGVVQDSIIVQTGRLQAVIDLASQQGGGVVVIPRGVFLSGSLFFKPGTHLYLEEGSRLKGSDRIEDFEIKKTRIEGETCDYFTALVNADQVDGFTISGKGTIDGNGYHYWKQFWLRRQWNRQCTNKDEQRPRLVYISNSKDVTVQDIRLVNSPFWTNHLYKCKRVRYLGCYIFAPTEGVKAPSSDAIDIDVCTDVLVNGCYMNVNDDAIAMKGGKGVWADTLPENGGNERILIENCHYGRVHSCLTLGSESLYNRNIILRNIRCDDVNRVLWLKMRPDTPQHYEYVTIEGIRGKTGSFLVVRPWTQFYKPEERKDIPLSRCNNITMKHIEMLCKNFFDVGKSEKYKLDNFTFENINITDEKGSFSPEIIEKTMVKKVIINGVKK